MTTTLTKNIYLADDDADDCMLFEDALKELNIESILTISNDGMELMETLDERVPPPPDVIFLDLNMPRKDGLECLKEIKQTSKLKDIPIVIFSTSFSPDVINETYKGGANRYICKPRSFTLLKKAIGTVLSMGLQESPQPSREQFVLKIA